MSPVPRWMPIFSFTIIISRLWRFGIFSQQIGGFANYLRCIGNAMKLQRHLEVFSVVGKKRRRGGAVQNLRSHGDHGNEIITMN